MIYTKYTKLAMKIAYDAHCGQVDKTGVPYIYHPIHIAERMEDEDSTIVALLHDVIEDTELTIEDLRKYGFSNEILESINVITKRKDDDYFNYIERIKNNKIALKVKVEDLRHNMDLTRIENVTQKDLIRLEKYKKAEKFLNQL